MAPSGSSRKTAAPKVKGEDWALAEAAITVAPRLLLYGPPGTGKTSWAVRRLENPIVVTLTPHTFAAELRGTILPIGDEAQMLDGALALAMREDRPLVLDEIGRAGKDAQAALLGGCAEGPSCMVTIPATGETVTPVGTGYKIIATANEISGMEPPLLDRFLRHAVIGPSPDLLATLPEAYRGVCDASARSQESISPRSWLRFAHFEKAGMKRDQAAALAFGERAEVMVDSLDVAAT